MTHRTAYAIAFRDGVFLMVYHPKRKDGRCGEAM